MAWIDSSLTGLVAGALFTAIAIAVAIRVQSAEAAVNLLIVIAWLLICYGAWRGLAQHGARWYVATWLFSGACALVLSAVLLQSRQPPEHGEKDIQALGSKPLFVPSLGQAFVRDYGTTTMVILAAGVLNKGAESSIIQWAAEYKSPTLNAKVDIIRIGDTSLSFVYPDAPTLALRDSDLIINKTAPIPHGGLVTGRLLIELPGSRRTEIDAGAEIIVTIMDYLDNRYSATFKGGSDTKDIEVLPGEVLPSTLAKRPKRPSSP